MLNDDAIWKSLNSPRRLFLIAGPCVIENEKLCLQVAGALKKTCAQLGIFYVFKASFDKANRTSDKSFRGPGLEEGLRVLAKVRAELGVPVLTDIHNEMHAAVAGEVVDILQIPAFLCRQTDLIEAAAATGQVINLKKGQFLSPLEMYQVAEKARRAGARRILLTERGTTFGYNNLVADMRSIPIMKSFGFPVIFDATHSVQLPGGGGDKSSGQREFAPVLARCALAAGANGLFIETHPNPDRALSDGPNMIPLAGMPGCCGDCSKYSTRPVEMNTRMEDGEWRMEWALVCPSSIFILRSQPPPADHDQNDKPIAEGKTSPDKIAPVRRGWRADRWLGIHRRTAGNQAVQHPGRFGPGISAPERLQSRLGFGMTVAGDGRRRRELGIDFLIQQGDRTGKTGAIEKSLRRVKWDWDAERFVGDDVVDLGPLKRAGFAVAAGDARPEVKAAAHYGYPCAGVGAARCARLRKCF